MIMSKKNPTKRKRGTAVSCDNDLGQELRDAIKVAAKVVSDAKKLWVKSCLVAVQPLAEKIGYANPKDAAHMIIEEVNADVDDDSAQEWESKLARYARSQQIEWKSAELAGRIKALEAERSQLDELN